MMMIQSSTYQSIHKFNTTQNKSILISFGNNVRTHGLKTLVSVLVFILLFTSFLIIGTSASEPVNDVADVDERVVTVSSGDTLWSIASRMASDDIQTGYVVFLIKERNQLNSVTITPGQILIIPKI